IAEAVPRSFAANGVMYGPVIDGWVLPKKPIELVESGAHSHVPLIVATTSNEFSTMVSNYVDGPLSTADDYAAMLHRRFPAVADRLLAHYPASDFTTPLAAYPTLWSASAFACQSDWLADAAASHQREPVYRFVFAHAYSGKLEHFGAGHGMDLYMIFRNTPP